MDVNYLKLFLRIAQTTGILAERVAEVNHSQNDTKGEETALSMRHDFTDLYDKMEQEDFVLEKLSKADYIKLLVGALVVMNNIEEHIKGQQKALEGYKTDLIPKLQRIVDECKTDDEVKVLAKDLFKILDPNN